MSKSQHDACTDNTLIDDDSHYDHISLPTHLDLWSLHLSSGQLTNNIQKAHHVPGTILGTWTMMPNKKRPKKKEVTSL